MVGTMIVATIAGTTAAGVAASFALTAAAMAVNFVVSTIVTRMFAPDVDSNQNTNNREQVPPTTDNAIPVVYGDAYLGGTFVDAVLSKDQQQMFYVLAISSISPNGQFTFDFSNMYYGGRKITFDVSDGARVVSLTDDAGNVDTTINGVLGIYMYTSSAAGVITPMTNNPTMPHQILTSAVVPSGQVWPSTGRQMNGTAFAIVSLTYNNAAGTRSLQPITFKVKHALNGTGVARPGDVWYDYMTSSVYGCAVDPAYVDSASAATLNTYSDQTITYTPVGGGSATQARYRINGVITGNISCIDNVDKILTACDTWMTYNAASGKWALVVNKAETAAFSFNDTNIIGEIRVSATDITQSVNQIEARFPFKENKDQSNFILLETPSGLLYPNEPVNKTSVTYELVNDSVQAQYLANRVLEQAREDLIVSFNTTYYGIQVDAGDVVSVTNADYGWSGKLFRVMKVNEVALADGSLGARLELSEYSAAVYDDASITAYSPVPNSNIAAPEYFSSLVAPTVSASRPDATFPSFDVQCTLPTTGRMTFVILYATTVAVPTNSDWFEISRQTVINGQPLTNGSLFLFQNVSLPAGTYYFSFVVGNEIATSAKSPSSTSLVWAPRVDSNARKSATVTVYKWTTTAAALPSGTSTYTWATQSFLPPTGWTLVPGDAPAASYVLISAQYDVSDFQSATTTTITWSQSRLLLIETDNIASYSPKIAFARVSGTITQTYGTITTTGASSFPSSASSLSVWGFSATWGATDPDPTSVNPLYRTDGVYNASTGEIVWSTPYIASLRVGALSAITTDTGSLNVSGNIIVGTFGNIAGGQTAYNTGTGFFLGYSTTTYKFSIGSSTNNMLWDGTNFAINGGSITGSSFQTGTTGSRLTMNVGSDNALKGYDSSNTLRTAIYADLGFMEITNLGSTFAVTGKSGTGAGVFGEATSGGNGVSGKSTTGLGVKGEATGTNGVGVEGRSTSYFGGAFYGGSTNAPLYLNPNGSQPTTGQIYGALACWGNKLYFHNGTAWKEVQFV